MPLAIKCPECDATLKVADDKSGKKIHCPKCAAVIPVRPSKMSSGTFSKVESKRRPSRDDDEEEARPRRSARRDDFDDDDDDDFPAGRRKKNEPASKLPLILICSVGFLLLIGLGVGAFFLFGGSDDNKQQQQVQNPGGDKGDNKKAGNDNKKAGDDNKKAGDDNKNPVPGTVQQPAVKIPLDTGSINSLFGVWSSGRKANQVVAGISLGETMLRLDRFDAGSGKLLDSTKTGTDLFASVRDLSIDGRYFLANHRNGTTLSIWALPQETPIVNQWWVVPADAPVTPAEHQIPAAHLLEGDRLVTIDGAGQVDLWSFSPSGGEPKKITRYTPPQSVSFTYRRSAVSADRKRLAVFNGKDGFFILDTADLKLQGQVKSAEDELRQVQGLTQAMQAVAFSPDGSQLAALFTQQKFLGRKKTLINLTYLVRWDLNTKERLARVADPTKLGKNATAAIGWWGKDYCWVTDQGGKRGSGLVAWNDPKKALALTPKGQVDSGFPGTPDGRYWYAIVGPQNTPILNALDNPGAGLQGATPGMKVGLDGIMK